MQDISAQLHAKLQTGLQHQQAGRLSEAEAQYRQVLAAQPTHPDALHLLGLLALRAGDLARAETLIRQALQSAPTGAMHNSLGSVQAAQGQLDAAAASFRQAIQMIPALMPAHFNLGNALKDLGQLDEAMACYRHAIGLNPAHLGALHNMGLACILKEDYPGAVEYSRRALAVNPRAAEAYNCLGTALMHLELMEEAEQAYRQAVSLQPGLAQAHCNLGGVLLGRGRLQEAQVALQRALALKPDLAEARSTLGLVYINLKEIDLAIECCRRAVELAPQSAMCLLNYGKAWHGKRMLTQADAAYAQALALAPKLVEAHNNRGNVQWQLGDHAAACACFRQAVAIQADFMPAYHNLLMTEQYAASCRIEDMLAAHRAFGEHFEAPRRKNWPVFLPADFAQKRLRIGFVSADLRTHPVGYFMESVLRELDPQAFEVLVYHNSDMEDEVTERLRPHVSLWRSAMGQSDDKLAQQIMQDKVHILVDLSGHTAGSRLGVFTRKPAPVQVTWLGYFSTTGLRAVDYILCDRHVAPEQDDDHFVEQAWRLPDSYLCFTPPSYPIEVGPLPALASGKLTLGCFNNLAKMGDEVVAFWSSLLQAMPEVRLFLKTGQFDEASTVAQTRARFAAYGIGEAQLLIEGVSPRHELLASYNRVDIALDPFPFPGGTTSVEALWMGVPVLTLQGDRFLSRVGVSILQSAGLPEWVAADHDDYLAKLQAWAADLPALQAVRQGLRARLLASPVCDAPRFARNLESAFQGMWRAYCLKEGLQCSDSACGFERFA